jgi:hypothetical protein
MTVRLIIGTTVAAFTLVENRDLMSPYTAKTLKANEFLASGTNISSVDVPAGTFFEIDHIVSDHKNPRHQKGVVYLKIMGAPAGSQSDAFGELYMGWSIAVSQTTLNQFFVEL